MPKPDLSHGKKFEKEVAGCFWPLRLTLPILWKRVVDTAAAGNVIGKADGDFELTVNSGDPGKPYRFSIECKASTVHKTLASCFRSIVKADQVAKMRLQDRAGAVGIYLFKTVELNEIEVWYGKPLNEVFANKREAIATRPSFVISSANFPVFAKLICESPASFLLDLVKRSGVSQANINAFLKSSESKQ